jgi:hypothetical protein
MTKEYVVKDSGDRRSFESGMVRDTDKGKTLWHLITAGPLARRLAVHLTKGAVKYGPNNWLKAKGQEEHDRFRESAFRHFMQWYYDETDEDHFSATVFNMNGTEYVREANPDVTRVNW